MWLLMTSTCTASDVDVWDLLDVETDRVSACVGDRMSATISPRRRWGFPSFLGMSTVVWWWATVVFWLLMPGMCAGLGASLNNSDRRLCSFLLVGQWRLVMRRLMAWRAWSKAMVMGLRSRG